MQINCVKSLVISSVYLLTAFQCIHAQVERYDEDQIRKQSVFIEANKEKLMGRYEKARDLYLELYREDRSNDVVAYELSKVYAALEDYEESENYALRAIDLNPGQEYYYRFMAEIMTHGKRDAELTELYEKMIRIFGPREQYYFAWAEAYERIGDLKQAIKVYDEFEKEKGVVEEIIKRKFQWYAKSGEESKAVNELKKLIEENPENVRYLNNLAGYQSQTGNQEEALKIYKDVIKLDPENDQANIALALEDVENGNPNSYLLSLRPIIQNPEINIDTKIMELIPFVEDMDKNQMTQEPILSLLQDLQNAHPEAAKAYAIFGDAFLKSGMTRKAIEKYQKTIELNHTVFSVWEQLMYSLNDIRDFAELAAVAEQAMDYYPNHAICYYFYSLSQFQQQHYRDASDYIQDALLIAPKNSSIFFNSLVLSTKIHLELDEDYKAYQQVSKALDFSENVDPTLLELMGDVLFKLSTASGRDFQDLGLESKEIKEKASEYWQKAISAGGNNTRIQKKIDNINLYE